MVPLVCYILPDPSAGTGIQMIQLADESPSAAWDGATLLMGEEQSDDSDISDHPTEVGAMISDNSNPKPSEVTFTVTLARVPSDVNSTRASAAPVTLDVPVKRPISLFAGAIGAIGAALFGSPPAPVITTYDFDDYDPAQALYNALQVVKDQAALCDVMTSTRLVSNMLIKSIKSSKKEPGQTEITVSLRQIFTVSSSTVEAPKPLEPRAKAASSGGAQPPAPAAEPQKTLAAKGADAVIAVVKGL